MSGQDRIKELPKLLLILTTNLLSIIGYVLWCSNSEIPGEIIIDRAFDIGYFGGMYLLAMLLFFLQILKPELASKNSLIRVLMRYSIILCYFVVIAMRLLQGIHFILPAAYGFLATSSLSMKTISYIGFAVDIFFIVMCLIEIFGKIKALPVWSIVMGILDVVLLACFICTASLQSYLFFEITASIVWHIYLYFVFENLHKKRA